MLTDKNGLAPISYAIKSDKPITVKILAEAKKSDLNKPIAADGFTALHLAISSRLSVVQILLRTGKVDVNTKTAKGDTALHLAVALLLSRENGMGYPYVTLVQSLLESKANANIRNNEKRTPFDLLPNPVTSRVQSQIRDLLKPRMAPLALKAGFHSRAGRGSMLNTLSRSPLFDRQILTLVFKSALVNQPFFLKKGCYGKHY